MEREPRVFPKMEIERVGVAYKSVTPKVYEGFMMVILARTILTETFCLHLPFPIFNFVQESGICHQLPIRRSALDEHDIFFQITRFNPHRHPHR